jgi:hypothetical protein
MRRLAATAVAGALLAACSGGSGNKNIATAPPTTADSTCGPLSDALAQSLSLPRPSGQDPSFTNEDAPLSKVLPGSGHAASGHDPVVRQAGCQYEFNASGGKISVQVLFLRPQGDSAEFDDLLIGGAKSDGMNEIGGVGQRASYLGNTEGDTPFGELHVLVAHGYGFSLQVNATRAKADLATPDGIRHVAAVVLASVH